MIGICCFLLTDTLGHFHCITVPKNSVVKKTQLSYYISYPKATTSPCPVRWLFVATHISVATRGKLGVFPSLGVPTSVHQPNYEFSIIKEKKKQRMANDVSMRNYGSVSKFRREVSGMSRHLCS